MNQDKGEGHSFITREAVRQMFAERHVTTIDGLTEEQYAARLDAAQEHQDRTTDFSDLPDQLQHGAPLGPTVRPSSWDPDVQRQHAMADPSLSGADNLAIDRQFIVGELDAAHAAQGDVDQEMAHLGAAVHATEDSYSEAHMWRGDAVHSGDPTAPIEAINNFDWTDMTAVGSGDSAVLLEGTHDARFDYAPVRDGREVLGVDRAAVDATKHVLEHYEDSRGQNAADADASMQAAVDPYFQGAADGVTVNRTADAGFVAEDQRRWEIQQQQMSDAGIDSLQFSGMDEALHLGAEGVQAVESEVHTVEDTAVEVYHDVSDAVSNAATAVESAAADAWHATEHAVDSVVEGIESIL